MLRPLALVAYCCLYLVPLLAPAADGDGRSKEQPSAHEVVNKAKDIRVFSDREEATVDFFRRQRVVVGAQLGEEVAKLLAAKEKQRQVFVSYASFNDDPDKAALFGASLDVLPPSPAVVSLLAEQKADDGKQAGLTLIFVRDAKDEKSYRLVGFTRRSPVSFFDDTKRHETDGVSQSELRFKKAGG